MITENGELRCDNERCNKKLGEIKDFNGKLEIVCPRCKRHNTFNKPLTNTRCCGIIED